MSAPPLQLTGVLAHSPMGLLVALGTLDVLAEHIDRGARLCWDETGATHRAVLRCEGASTVAALAGLVLDAVARDSLGGLPGDAADLNKILPTELHGVLASGQHARILAGLCAEAPLRPAGQVSMTPLAITSFKGRRSVFPTLLRADAALSERHVRALFDGPWTYVKNAPTLNLDPAAREQDSARMAADASADGTRGVAGALSLVVRGLALMPPMPVRSGRGQRPRVGALHDRKVLTWPVWTVPVTRFGAGALMGRNWAARRDDGSVRDACGVVAVYGSEIVDAKDGRRLARARRVA